jgi:hypothetical protein
VVTNSKSLRLTMPTGREVNLNWRFWSVLIRSSGSHIANLALRHIAGVCHGRDSSGSCVSRRNDFILSDLRLAEKPPDRRAILTTLTWRGFGRYR